MKNTAVYMRFPTRAAAFALAALWCAVLFLSGCTPQEETTPTASISGTTGSISPSVSYEAVSGGLMRIPMPVKPETLDPLKASTVEMTSLLSLVYETPVQIEQDGHIVPSLFESWVVEENGDVVFTVRNNISWHGGKGTLSAADIIHTLDTIKADNAGNKSSVYAYCLEEIEAYELYVATDTPQSQPPTTQSQPPTTQSQAPTTQGQPAQEGAGKVRIKAKNGLVALLYCLNFPVVSKENAQSTLPVGTGPYVVESYTQGEGMHLAANTSWWKKAPYIQEIYAKAVVTNASALELFRNNELDVVYSGALNTQSYKVAGSTSLSEVPVQEYSFLSLNVSNQHLANQQVRQALEYALDRNDLLSRIFSKHGVAVDFPMLPGNYLNDVKYSHTTVNINAAKDLLAKSNYIDRDGDGFVESDSGLPFTLTLIAVQEQDVSTYVDMADSIAEQFKKIGIQLEVKALSEADYKKALTEKTFDIAVVTTYLSSKPSIGAFTATDGALNFGGYIDAELNAAIDAMNAADEAAIVAAVDEVQRLFQEKIPHISILFRSRSFLYRNTIKNVTGISEPYLFDRVHEWYIYEQ
ncbi:ABC transporter substrate-binding protein [Clostridia bacterium OttesenSCG-928-F22]|nr:ABC transporter substrate-binding protein [Clostridia bacterium OttesenSCG-928-F22]